MDVYWLEQTEADVPAENRWLSPGELLTLGRLRFAKRSSDWRLGRWTAKRALAHCLNLPSHINALANIEIQAAPSGAPEVVLPNQRAAVTISLSHRAGTAVCAVAQCSITLGCDLELVEPRSDAFLADYLTANEQVLFVRTSLEERPLLVTLCWSAKESALKGLREGLRLDTRCMDVLPVDALPRQSGECRQDMYPVSPLSAGPNGWRPLQVRYYGGQVFCGWWRHADHMVRTIVSAVPLRSPIHCCSSLAPENLFSSIA